MIRWVRGLTVIEFLAFAGCTIFIMGAWNLYEIRECHLWAGQPDSMPSAAWATQQCATHGITVAR